MKKINLLVSSILLLSITACNAPVVQDNLAVLTESQQANINSAEKNKYNKFKSDLWIAQSDARRWDISSNLVKAEANWIDQSGNANWTFYFKSPFKKNAYKTSSMGFGQEVPNSFFGMDIRDFDVRVDSDKALELAKAQGLKTFPVSSMTLEKRFGYAEWEIRSSNGTFRINAESLAESTKK